MTISKTMLGESPKEPSSRLLEIKPNEVSAVDMPAIGEAFIVVKSVNGKKKGIDKVADKLNTSQVPRRVMKVVDNRLKNISDSVKYMGEVAKSINVDEKNEEKKSPKFLHDMAKGITSDLRSLQSNDETKVSKRGTAESVVSLQELTKRNEDIEKANAVSYVTRDQYINVTSSVSEYLTTYMDGIEHDSDGPMLIPIDLETTVENSAKELEKLTEEFPADEDTETQDIDESEEIKKLNSEIERLKSTIQKVKSEKEDISTVEKRGSKMASDRFKRLCDVSQSISKSSSSLTEIIDELNESEENMEDQDTTTETEGTQDTVTKTETTKETTEKKTDDSANDPINSIVEKQFDKIQKFFSEKFESLEKSVEEVTSIAKGADEKVDKLYKSRGDAKGGETEADTSVNKTVADKASFASILKLKVLE